MGGEVLKLLKEALKFRAAKNVGHEGYAQFRKRPWQGRTVHPAAGQRKDIEPMQTGPFAVPEAGHWAGAIEVDFDLPRTDPSQRPRADGTPERLQDDAITVKAMAQDSFGLDVTLESHRQLHSKPPRSRLATCCKADKSTLA